MNEIELVLPRSRDYDAAVADPIQCALLEDWAAMALRMWLRSPTFRARASYRGKIVPVLFNDGGLPLGSYHENTTTLLKLWKRFGWVTEEYTKKGWPTADDPRPATLATYRSMADSHNDEVRTRGYELLYREVSQSSYSMVTVDLTKLAEDLVAQLDPPSLMGRSVTELAEEHDAPLRVMKELWKVLVATGKYERKLVRIGGEVKRVLSPRLGEL